MEFLLPGRTRIGDDGRKRGRRKEPLGFFLAWAALLYPTPPPLLVVVWTRSPAQLLCCTGVAEREEREGTRKRFQPEGGTENVSVLVRVFNVVVVVVGSCAWG